MQACRRPRGESEDGVIFNVTMLIVNVLGVAIGIHTQRIRTVRGSLRAVSAIALGVNFGYMIVYAVEIAKGTP